MALNNPCAEPNMDVQDIRAEQYATMNPARRILRVEGLASLVLACVLYQSQGFSWFDFGLWLFLPDIAILVCVFGSTTAGVRAYNLTHSTIGAALVSALGILFTSTLLLQIGLIWFAHIGFDRALGYGLKFHLGFRVTHLGVLRGMRDKA